MADHGKHIDDLFREGLGNYRESPASDIWSKLEQRLPKEDDDAAPVVVVPRSDRRWLWYLLLFAMLGTVGYFMLRRTLETSTSIRPAKKLEKGGIASGNGTAGSGSMENSKTGTGNSDQDRNGNTHGPSAPANNYSATPDNTKGDNQTEVTNTPGKNSGSNGVNTNTSAGNAGNTTVGKAGSNNNAANTVSSISNSTNKSSTTNTQGKEAESTTTATSSTSNTRNSIEQANNNGLNTPNATVGKTTTPVVNSSTSNNNTSASEPAVVNTPSGARTVNNGPKPKTQKTRSIEGSTEQTDYNAKQTTQEPLIADPLKAEQPEILQKNGEPVSSQSVDPVKATKPTELPALPPVTPKTTETPAEGIKINNTQGSLEEPVIAAAANNEDGSAEEDKNETVPPAEEISEAEQATGSGSGGAGAEEPNVPLRNFANSGKLAGGFKAGYERGLGQIPANSAVFAPYLQWNITPKAALIFQPSFRYNSISRNVFGYWDAYHSITHSSMDTSFKYDQDSAQGPLIQRTYYFGNTYDSVVMVRSLDKSTYFEVDLPLMAKFNIGSRFSLSGGVFITYGNLLRINSSQSLYSGLQRQDTVSYGFVPVTEPEPQFPSPSEYFTYNTPDISTAPKNSDLNPSGNPARFGYMLGVSYDIGQKFMVDVMLRQNLSDMRYIPNEQVRKVYTQPSLRVMFGVKLFESGNNAKKEPTEP